MTRLVFAYLRVSTRKQDEENQRLQITNYARSHDLAIPEDGWFTDAGVSGYKFAPMERKGFRDLYDTLDAMTQEDKATAPVHVVVYEISRVGRNFWEVLEVVKILEERWPIISTSPKEAFLQTEDRSMRQLFLSILAWAAEREREMLVQRTLEGVTRAKEEKRHSGNVPLGYDIHRCIVGDCISKVGDQCDLHGKLMFTEDGRKVHGIISSKPSTKPRELKGEIPSLGSDYERFAIIRNVKKFGIPELS